MPIVTEDFYEANIGAAATRPVLSDGVAKNLIRTMPQGFDHGSKN